MKIQSQCFPLAQANLNRQIRINLKSGFTTLIATLLLATGCNPKDKEIPGLRGQSMSQQEVTDLAFEFTLEAWNATDFHTPKVRKVEETLPKIHKWFQVGIGIHPSRFKQFSHVYFAAPIPQYVIDDLDKVLVSNYTPFVPLILTAQFWKDMKKLSENPLVPLELGFSAGGDGKGAITARYKSNRLSLVFSTPSGPVELIHEITHVRQAMLEILSPQALTTVPSTLTKDCEDSLKRQMGLGSSNLEFG